MNLLENDFAKKKDDFAGKVDFARKKTKYEHVSV